MINDIYYLFTSDIQLLLAVACSWVAVVLQLLQLDLESLHIPPCPCMSPLMVVVVPAPIPAVGFHSPLLLSVATSS
jgi:hypothetical protein